MVISATKEVGAYKDAVRCINKLVGREKTADLLNPQSLEMRHRNFNSRVQNRYGLQGWE